MKTLSLILCLSLASCTTSNDLGNGVVVKSQAHLFAPSVTVVLKENAVAGIYSDHAFTNVVAPSAVTGGAFIAGMNTYGSNLKPDSFNVNAEGGDASGASATGGAGGSINNLSLSTKSTGGNATGGSGGLGGAGGTVNNSSNIKTDQQGRSYRPRDCE